MSMQSNSERCPIPGFPGYEASRAGDIYGVRGWKLAPARHSHGYRFVQLGRGNQRYVHRLVALTFLGPCPDGWEVNHKDGNKANNAVENLEYVTSKENKAHAAQNGLARHAQGEAAKHTLTNQDVLEIRALGVAGMPQKEIAERYGVRTQTIGSILRGKAWKHAGGPRVLRGHAGKHNARSKLKPQDVQEIKLQAKSGISQKSLAQKYGVHKSTIGSILRGETWTCLDQPEGVLPRFEGEIAEGVLSV